MGRARSDVFLQFMRSLSIRTRDRRIDTLKFNVPQQMVWEQIQPKLDAGEKVWTIVLKARREGISTLSEALLLTWTATEDLVHSVVTAHEAPATKRIAEMADLMINHSPLKHVTRKVGTQRFIGRSKLDISTAGSPEAQRGADITAFHGSEVAFWPHPEALTATMQAIPYNTQSLCILESTANGKVYEGQLFYQEWLRASAGDSDFLPIFLPWFQMPEYRMPGMKVDDLSDLEEEEREGMKQFGWDIEQVAWRRYAIQTLCQGDLDKFHQEYPSTPDEAFIQSGLPFFRKSDLLYLEKCMEKGQRYRIDRTGRLERDETGPLTIWRMPVPGHQYVAAADSSLGIDDDSRSRSAVEVLDMETMEQVAEYDAAAAPHVLGRHLVGIGRLYNEALLCPEVQASGGGGGREVLRYIQDCDYWNIHRWKSSGPDRVNPTAGSLYGWETTSRTRPRMLANLIQVVKEQTCIIHSRTLLDQFHNFGQNDSERYEAISGHDDLLMSYCMALVSRTENYFAQASMAKVQKTNWEAAGMRVQKNFEVLDEAHFAEVKRGRPGMLADQDIRVY